MRKHFIISLMSALIFLILDCSGQNLVLNPSLEDWEDGKPKHWSIEQGSVDIMKADFKLIPFGVDPENEKYKSFYPSRGATGLTYFALSGVESEIISCKLREPLKENEIYELSYYIQKTKLFNQTFSDTLTVRFRTSKGYSEPLPVINPHTELDIWSKVSLRVIGQGNEQNIEFGYFGDFYKEPELLDVKIFYLYDNVSLIEVTEVDTTINIYFDKGSTVLHKDDLSELHSSLKNYAIDEVRIEGYASKEGTADDNLSLSKQRAQSVLDIVNEYLPEKNISYDYFGSRESKSNDYNLDRVVKVTFSFSPTVPNEKETEYPGMSNDLKKRVAKLFEVDQDIRSKDIDSLEFNRLDSLNIESITSIIDSIGYPGISLIGSSFMDYAFIMLLHANYEVRKKYESQLIEATMKGEATKAFIPYLIDKNLLDENKKQLYGTQVFFDENKKKFVVYPVRDEDKVDDRRLIFRLQKLDDYLKSFNN